MTTPRLSSPSNAIETQVVGLESEKIAKSESLSALFSYFKNWSSLDSSLKFKGDSVIKTLVENKPDEEVAA